MASDRPPKGLPPGYRPLWTALAQAADGAPSRAELARGLGVSTHTIQRILVDGRPPDFRNPHSRRLELAWVRTIARLARGLEADPRRWIEGVGIAWTDDARSAAEAAVVGLRARDAGKEERFPGVTAHIRRRAASGDPEPVRAGVVPLGPYEPFLRAWVDRLVGAVDPAWGVRWVRASPDEITEGLLVGRLDLGAGLFESPRLGARGLRFLPVPGCRPVLKALLVCPPSAVGEVAGWEDLTYPGAGPPLLVRGGDPAAALAHRQWRIPPDRLVSLPRLTPAGLAGAALAEAERRDAAVAIIADEVTVRAAHDHATAADVAPGFAAMEIAALPDEEPSYPLAIATGPDEDLLPLLGRAQESELFGAARTATAALYADLVFDGARDLLALGREAAASTAPLVRLRHFPEAVPEIRRPLVRRLLATLAAAVPEHDDAWGRALDIARRVCPAEWRPALEQAALALAGPAHPGPGLCRSCSASLLENRGPAEVFCRYCADENGELRPREEVRRILAGWMREWQGRPPPDEALRRADRFMSTMPAWADVAVS